MQIRFKPYTKRLLLLGQSLFLEHIKKVNSTYIKLESNAISFNYLNYHYGNP